METMGPLANMPTGPAAIFWGGITFSLLVVIHEGGHFLAARAFKIKVHEFMIGLPGPALRFRSKRTGVFYGVTAIPLGGYVRIAGMEPGAEDELLGPALIAVRRLGNMHPLQLAEELRVTNDRASALLTTLADWGAVEAGPSTDDYVISPDLARADTSPLSDALCSATAAEEAISSPTTNATGYACYTIDVSDPCTAPNYAVVVDGGGHIVELLTMPDGKPALTGSALQAWLAAVSNDQWACLAGQTVPFCCPVVVLLY